MSVRYLASELYIGLFVCLFFCSFVCVFVFSQFCLIYSTPVREKVIYFCAYLRHVSNGIRFVLLSTEIILPKKEEELVSLNCFLF